MVKSKFIQGQQCIIHIILNADWTFTLHSTQIPNVVALTVDLTSFIRYLLHVKLPLIINSWFLQFVFAIISVAFISKFRVMWPTNMKRNYSWMPYCLRSHLKLVIIQVLFRGSIKTVCIVFTTTTICFLLCFVIFWNCVCLKYKIKEIQLAFTYNY